MGLSRDEFQVTLPFHKMRQAYAAFEKRPPRPLYHYFQIAKLLRIFILSGEILSRVFSGLPISQKILDNILNVCFVANIVAANKKTSLL